MIFDNHGGRVMELITGIVVLAIVAILTVLVLWLLFSWKMSIGVLITSILLIGLIYWLGEIAYRMILNKPRADGGLINPTTLKIFSIMISIYGAFLSIFSLIYGHFSWFIVSIFTLVVSYKCWQIAVKRIQHQASTSATD